MLTSRCGGGCEPAWKALPGNGRICNGAVSWAASNQLPMLQRQPFCCHTRLQALHVTLRPNPHYPRGAAPMKL